MARRRRTLAIVALVALSVTAGMLGLASPARTQSGWTPLLKPIAHLGTPALPALRVAPGNTEVLRGADLEIEVDAVGRATVTLLSRAEGDVLRRQSVAAVRRSNASTRPRSTGSRRRMVRAARSSPWCRATRCSCPS
jgi:hypothetical protein